MAVIAVLVSPHAGICLSEGEVFDLLSRESKEIEAFPFHVYANPSDYGPFKGTALPVWSYDFFQSVYDELKFKQPDEIFATYLFSQGTRWKCFLLRVPGMYSTDAIDLWVFDTVRAKWQRPLRIADSWGDAGEDFEVQSWMGDVNNDGKVDIIRRTLRTFLDPGNPDAKVSILERKNAVFVWEKDHFKNDSQKYLPEVDLKKYRFTNKDIQ